MGTPGKGPDDQRRPRVASATRARPRTHRAVIPAGRRCWHWGSDSGSDCAAVLSTLGSAAASAERTAGPCGEGRCARAQPGPGCPPHVPLEGRGTAPWRAGPTEQVSLPGREGDTPRLPRSPAWQVHSRLDEAGQVVLRGVGAGSPQGVVAARNHAGHAAKRALDSQTAQPSSL